MTRSEEEESIDASEAEEDSGVEEGSETPSDEEQQPPNGPSTLSLEPGPGKRKKSLLPPKPRAKLDSARILGPNGFNLLFTRAKRLRFKGRGHETEDLRQLISFYKDWAHGLFPKLPYEDVIKMVERRCRTRDLHVSMHRDAWLVGSDHQCPHATSVLCLEQTVRMDCRLETK